MNDPHEPVDVVTGLVSAGCAGLHKEDLPFLARAPSPACAHLSTLLLGLITAQRGQGAGQEFLGKR